VDSEHNSKGEFQLNESERLTIMLNADLAKKLRNIQAKMIKENSSTVSFSRVVNETLRKCL